MEVKISTDPLFLEAWHEGAVTYNGTDYKFWLINPVRLNTNEHDYEPEVRWFFKSVPIEVRAMYNEIIEQFKKTNYDNRTSKNERSSL